MKKIAIVIGYAALLLVFAIAFREGSENFLVRAQNPVPASSGSGNSTICIGSASATAATCTPSPAITTYTGLTGYFTAGATSTGAPLTLDISGLGTRNVYLNGTATSTTNTVINGTGYTIAGVDGTNIYLTGGGGQSPFSQTVTAVSSIAITHNLGTSQPWVTCYDGSGNILGGATASTSITNIVATSANVATVTFSGTTTGVCLVTTGSIGPVGATGATGATGAAGSNGVASSISVGGSTITTQSAPNFQAASLLSVTNPSAGNIQYGMASQAADTLVINATGGNAVPTAVTMPTCTTGADLYNTSTHTWSCVSIGGGTIVQGWFSGTCTNSTAVGNGVSSKYFFLGAGTTTCSGSSENAGQIPVPVTGHLANLWVITGGTQNAGGNLVITARSCTPTSGACTGSATTLTVTLAAGGAATELSDTTHTPSVTAGDLVSLQITNNASGAAAAFILGWGFQLTN